MKKKLSVIIPCFNEEAVILETYNQLQVVLNNIAYEYELVFINDGSQDNTLSILQEFASQNKQVKIINFSRNFGHQCAVSAGINNCKGDFRLIDRKSIDNFKNLKENNKYIRGLISWIGYIQVPCYYDRERRFAGDSKYSLKKMMSLALIGLFYFSKKPLQFPFKIDFGITVLGLFYVLLIIFLTIFNIGEIYLFIHLILMGMVLLSGLILLSIGILDNYIICLFDEVKNRPEYIIDEKFNF